MAIVLRQRKEKILPIAPIRQGVIFPHTEIVLSFGRPQSVAAVEAAFKSDRLICFFSQKNPRTANPSKEELYPVGTLSRIERILRTENELHAWVKGISRVKLEFLQAIRPFLVAEVVEIPEVIENTDEVKALAQNLSKKFQEGLNLGKQVDVMTVMRLLGENSPFELADQVAYTLEVKTTDKQKLLETFSVKERLIKTTEFLMRELKILELERTISSKTQSKFDKSMRETILRERKRTIEKELGEVSEDEDIKELKEKIQKAKMPRLVAQKAKKELKRLILLSPAHPETGYIRTYLDWLTEMPWSAATPNNTSISQAAKVLNQDHFGLSKVKERVVEYLAVMKLKEKKKQKEGKESTIICFVGPPGVGKTSIGKSIARALGRKFVRISLGGIRDEAEIRGHRRTYVGALPGRIIQGIKNAGTNNPVFMLDEIDKVGADFRGDPSAALLEALDSE